MDDENFDVVVVGSGASGSVVAYRLINAGFRVCCIESGARVDPCNYPMNFPDWERRKSEDFPINPNVRVQPWDYGTDCSESPISVANFCGVGGSTLLFSGHYPRFHPSDFCSHSKDGVGKDWPVTYDDLAPYYRENEKYLGVSGLSGDPVYPDSLDHLQPPVFLGNSGETLLKGMRDLGWHCWPSYSAILTSKARGSRSICTNIGQCNTGCPNGAKASTDVTFIRDAELLGLKLITETVVQRVIIDDSGSAVGVEMMSQRDKTRTRLYGKKIVLAANAIGSCRILANSSQSGILGNSSGLIGKNFMIHPLGYVQAEIDGLEDCSIGPQGSWVASHEFYDSDLSRGFVRGYSMQFLRNYGPVELTYNASLMGQKIFGKDFAEEVKRRVNNTVGAAIICEDIPRLENQIEISNIKDIDGLPKVALRYTLDENTKKMMIHGMNQGKKLFRHLGGKRIFAYGPVRSAGWHLCGTTCMGFSPLDSVVNPTGEMHDIPNLFIVDGGIFPTSSGVNPAATIQALAAYIADHVGKALK